MQVYIELTFIMGSGGGGIFLYNNEQCHAHASGLSTIVCDGLTFLSLGIE